MASDVQKLGLDRLRDGTRQSGGRWNPIGYPEMYTDTTSEICVFEKFVHLGDASSPPLVIVSIDLR